MNVLGLRQRYITTKTGKLRLRVHAGIAFAGLLLGSVAFSSFDGTSGQQSMIKSAQAAATAEPVSAKAALTNDVAPEEVTSTQGMHEQKTKTAQIYKASYAAQPAVKPKPEIRSLTIKSGDSLSLILDRLNISASEAYQAIEALSAEYDPRDIRAGQRVSVELADGRLANLALDLSQLETVYVASKGEGVFEASAHTKPVKWETGGAVAEINSNTPSLYLALSKNGVPTDIILQLIKAYSWDVDFQRDIQPGNTVKVFYDQSFVKESGEPVKGKSRLLFASLESRGETLPIYFFRNASGRADYYDGSGQSIRKALLTTPVDGARVSSGYGMRRHPVLGYNKMHKGVDFAAPTGTPVYAAGDGVVERASRWSSYGHYIRLRHMNGIQTAYAHLHGYAKGLYVGKRVQQGDVIGYVGSTGRSTGPHLHYEVIKNGQQVNPNSIDIPSGEKLKGKDLENFLNAKRLIDQERRRFHGESESVVASLVTKKPSRQN